MDKRIYNPGAPTKNPKGARVQFSTRLDLDTVAAMAKIKKDKEISYGQIIDDGVMLLLNMLEKES